MQENTEKGYGIEKNIIEILNVFCFVNCNSDTLLDIGIVVLCLIVGGT
jgi:hypothetical protein